MVYQTGRMRESKKANRYCKRASASGIFRFQSSFLDWHEQVADPRGGDRVTITGKQNEAARNWYQENQMPIIAYSSLARGADGGQDQEQSGSTGGRNLRSTLRRKAMCAMIILNVWSRCEELAEKKGCTVSQIALAVDVPAGT